MFIFAPVANKFVPYRGQAYYQVDSSKGYLVRKHTWSNDRYDNKRLKTNNVFRTLTGAQAVRTAIVAINKAAQTT
jgi:hypothetical protein